MRSGVKTERISRPSAVDAVPRVISFVDGYHASFHLHSPGFVDTGRGSRVSSVQRRRDEMADMPDSKSGEAQASCRFKSDRRQGSYEPQGIRSETTC